jgi:phage major head subunit gpT-like protein
MGKFDSVWTPVLAGAFLTEYEGSVDKMWTTPITRKYDSPGEFLKLVDLGTVGAVRQLSGGRQFTAPIAYTQTIQNVVYELSMSIDVEDVRRDNIGMWEAKAAEMGGKFADHVNKLAISQLTTNPTCFDGVAFYGSTHPVNGTTQNNDLTSSQVAALATASGGGATPTAVEMMNSILGCVSWFYTLTDEAGDPLNGSARKFLLATSNPNIYASAVTAIGSIQLYGGSTDILSKLDAKGYQFDATMDPRLGSQSSTVFYLFRTDSVIKPLVWSEEFGVEINFLGDGSYNAVHDNQYIWASKATRALAPGRYQHAIRATLS